VAGSKLPPRDAVESYHLLAKRLGWTWRHTKLDSKDPICSKFAELLQLLGESIRPKKARDVHDARPEVREGISLLVRLAARTSPSKEPVISTTDTDPIALWNANCSEEKRAGNIEDAQVKSATASLLPSPRRLALTQLPLSDDTIGMDWDDDFGSHMHSASVGPPVRPGVTEGTDRSAVVLKEHTVEELALDASTSAEGDSLLCPPAVRSLYVPEACELTREIVMSAGPQSSLGSLRARALELAAWKAEQKSSDVASCPHSPQTSCMLPCPSPTATHPHTPCNPPSSPPSLTPPRFLRAHPSHTHRSSQITPKDRLHPLHIAPLHPRPSRK